MATDSWPTAEGLVKRLFRSRWSDLQKDYRHLLNGRYPGVYLLAYSDQPLLGLRIREADVFYVGMSNESVSRRLKKFIDAIETGKGHAAGNRFHDDSKMRKKGHSFFVSSLSIPCITKKEERKAKDLRRMGLVALLEYYCLASIREKCRREPELNKR